MQQNYYWLLSHDYDKIKEIKTNKNALELIQLYCVNENGRHKFFNFKFNVEEREVSLMVVFDFDDAIKDKVNETARKLFSVATRMPEIIINQGLGNYLIFLLDENNEIYSMEGVTVKDVRRIVKASQPLPDDIVKETCNIIIDNFKIIFENYPVDEQQFVHASDVDDDDDENDNKKLHDVNIMLLNYHLEILQEKAFNNNNSNIITINVAENHNNAKMYQAIRQGIANKFCTDRHVTVCRVKTFLRLMSFPTKDGNIEKKELFVAMQGYYE